jgi:hypothetical protein
LAWSRNDGPKLVAPLRITKNIHSKSTTSAAIGMVRRNQVKTDRSQNGNTQPLQPAPSLSSYGIVVNRPELEDLHPAVRGLSGSADIRPVGKRCATREDLSAKATVLRELVADYWMKGLFATAIGNRGLAEQSAHFSRPGVRMRSAVNQ